MIQVWTKSEWNQKEIPNESIAKHWKEKDSNAKHINLEDQRTLDSSDLWRVLCAQVVFINIMMVFKC